MCLLQNRSPSMDMADTGRIQFDSSTPPSNSAASSDTATVNAGRQTPWSTTTWPDRGQQQQELKQDPALRRCKVEIEHEAVNDGTVGRHPPQNGAASLGRIPAVRFLFYERGEWKDFCPDAIGSLVLAFCSLQSAARISIRGKKYLVDFLRMLQFNLATGYLRSIAWIDANGKCSFPPKCVEGYAVHLLRSSMNVCAAASAPSQSGGVRDSLRRDVSSGFPAMEESVQLHAIAGYDRSPAYSCPQSCVTTTESTGDVSSAQVRINFGHLENKIVKLDETDSEFSVVKGKFVSGLSRLASYVTVTEISKNCHRSASAQVRYEAFKKQEEMTRNMRGDTNLRYGWLSTSKQGVCDVILHGFGKSMASMYGVGVYLSPENCSYLSCIGDDLDEFGEQHVILCRVILGNVERVLPGSDQFHPSSEDYDCGVDDLSDPKRYVVWSTHMNTHILPEYIVSFKIDPLWTEIISELRLRNQQHAEPQRNVAFLPLSTSMPPTPQAVNVDVVQRSIQTVGSRLGTTGAAHCRKPRSPWMSFPMLFVAMKGRLSAGSMGKLRQHHADFKAGRMSRREFIRRVRREAGDDLVADCIRRMMLMTMTIMVRRQGSGGR